MISVGFSPVTASSARVLVLGSLPGRVSLEMRQYYAQPRNAFWKLMGRLYNFEPEAPYAKRLGVLKKSRVALWDVCASAARVGSLDAAIITHSVVVNDIAGFLREHKQVHTVCFNGQKAAALFTRFVLPTLASNKLNYVLLPSSSPAHAAMPFSIKLRNWTSVRRASET